MYGYTAQNTALCEELASCGFLVISVRHNGDCIDSDPFLGFAPEDVKEDKDEKAFWRTQFANRAADLSFVLDCLQNLQDERADPHLDGLSDVVVRLAQAADLTGLIVGGHSFGGGTAAVFSARDPRCRTAVVLDGWFWPLDDEILGLSRTVEDRESEGQGAERLPPLPPVLVISASHWDLRPGQTPGRKNLVEKRKGSRHLQLTQSGHHNFNDMPLLHAPGLLRRKSMIGQCDAVGSVRCLNALVTGWCNDFARNRKLATARFGGGDELAPLLSSSEDRTVLDSFQSAMDAYRGAFDWDEGDPKF
jgi:pimeloyl-ACP methyl ester carboxylesterase